MMLWSDEWCQWSCEWYDELRCYLMRIHHCWWTMPMTDATIKAEIWCWCSDLMNDANDRGFDTTNDAATWCWFTIADERCQWQMRCMKLRFDADALIWWMMSMILWLIRRMMLLPHADSPLLMNDANGRCDSWNWDLMLILWSDEWCQWSCEWYDECCYPCRFTISDERCQRLMRGWVMLGFDADALIWWMIKWMTRLLEMLIHHCWWTMTMKDAMHEVETLMMIL